MAVNSVSGATKVDAYDAYGRKSSAKKGESAKGEKTTESGVVYEKSAATTGKGAYSVTSRVTANASSSSMHAYSSCTRSKKI